MLDHCLLENLVVREHLVQAIPVFVAHRIQETIKREKHKQQTVRKVACQLEPLFATAQQRVAHAPKHQIHEKVTTTSE